MSGTVVLLLEQYLLALSLALFVLNTDKGL